MSAYTGPTPEILAAVTIPDTNTNAMTAFRALGNSVRLRVTTTGGSCTSLTFTAEVSKDGTTYYDVIDRDSVWSFVSTVPNTAGAYDVEMEGLAVVPGEMVRLSYAATAAAGTLAVTAICWENPKGGGTSISVGDVVVDTDTMVSLLTTIDADTSALVAGTGASPSVTPATGAGAIATTTAVAAAWELNAVTIFWGGAIGAAESVVVSLDANDGAAYDYVMDSTVVTGETSYEYKPPGGPTLLESGDEVKVAFTGSDSETFGLRIVGKLV